LATFLPEVSVISLFASKNPRTTLSSRSNTCGSSLGHFFYNTLLFVGRHPNSSYYRLMSLVGSVSPVACRRTFLILGFIVFAKGASAAFIIQYRFSPRSKNSAVL